MATAITEADIKADPLDLWALWTDPVRWPRWLPVSAGPGPLVEGARFSWHADAPFVRPVRYDGRVRRLEPGRLFEFDLDLWFSPRTSTVTVEFGPGPTGHSRVSVRHEGLPDDDLGRFETNGYRHYWDQHLESLTAHAERRPSDHHHDAHVGVFFVGGHDTLGVLIGGVVRDSPAHRAGLQAGDILTAVDGEPVRSILGFDTWLDSTAPGATARFSLVRAELPVRIPDESHEGGETHGQDHRGADQLRVGPE